LRVTALEPTHQVIVSHQVPIPSCL